MGNYADQNQLDQQQAHYKNQIDPQYILNNLLKAVDLDIIEHYNNNNNNIIYNN
ncbi:hypothetical protein DICPUDRAFT_159765 [Dictyostelium purpureum]|uniref:Uncharacterized protein n=1 Tax=Dictyostelium purpureum TaxID=5786 RepID=F1A4Y2_DICPU|nr:uncharacterized protein DICPUDRAFT_159765 [Dictyostelium purpureum]EGC28745.1 hypothetical protein DICPUDRAFT_159765 [Dictyostelium purpureum]|eukprot:XP_003294724.1 hypothetical protein DICPUDRAFT_159765 [Dictyostelium purpureum]